MVLAVLAGRNYVVNVIVPHDSCLQTLQPWVFDLVQAMRVQDGNERVVVRHDFEM